MRAVLIDVKHDKLKIIDVTGGLEEMYRLLGYDCIDITYRDIQDEEGLYNVFNVVVDDEGMLEDSPIVSARSRDDMSTQLVGNLLVFGVDWDEANYGDLAGLSDDEVKLVLGSVRRVIDSDTLRTHPVLLLD
jgi:hypothetical protein